MRGRRRRPAASRKQSTPRRYAASPSGLLGCKKALADMIVVGGAQPVRGRAVRHPRPLREPRAIVADPVAQPEADAMHLADLAAAPGGAAQRQQHPVRPAMVVREVSEAQVVAAHGVGVYSKMSHPKEVAHRLKISVTEERLVDQKSRLPIRPW